VWPPLLVVVGRVRLVYVAEMGEVAGDGLWIGWSEIVLWQAMCVWLIVGFEQLRVEP
jgi:hypothetical protein